jgi:hypothetical protein
MSLFVFQVVLLNLEHLELRLQLLHLHVEVVLVSQLNFLLRCLLRSCKAGTFHFNVSHYSQFNSIN